MKEAAVKHAELAAPSTIFNLAEHMASITFEDITSNAKHGAIRCIVDVIGCAAAGRSTPIVDVAVRSGNGWARGAFASGNATVWFSGYTLSAMGAAYVNSLASSILDVDDGHRAASGHPGAAVIPAVLAVAETIGASLKDALLAIVCGYEAGISIAAARADLPSNTNATGRWSAVAVAVAVGKLYGLSVTELANAIGLAEVHAPNMSAADHAGFAGSHAKEGIPWSVVTGIAAADQAAVGFAGYLRALDNPLVYTAGSIRRRTHDDGFLIETTYFKPYACCRWTHGAIDAVLQIVDSGIDRSSIERIEVASFQRALSLQNMVRPEDIIAAQFSIPFVVSLAVIGGPEALLPMSPEMLDRDDVIELARRVALVPDSELNACFPTEVPARVTIKTRNDTIVRAVYTPLGDYRNPLTDQGIIEKATRLCERLRNSEEVGDFASKLIGSIGAGQEALPMTAFMEIVR